MTSERNNETAFTFRLSADDLQAVKHKAEAERMSAASYIRQAVLRQAGVIGEK